MQRLHRLAEKLASPAGASAGVPKLKNAAPGKFPGQVPWGSADENFDPSNDFDGFAKSLRAPAPICSELRVPFRESCLKQHHHSGAVRWDSRRMESTKLVRAILATTARGVQGACPARRPTAALRAQHRTGNLDGIERRRPGQAPWREITSAIDQTVCFQWVGEETPRPSPYICSRFGRVNTQHA